MFDFDGKVGGSSRVDLSGRGRKTGARQAEESRSDFVKRQHQEREARERKRIREAASRRIQAVYRGHCVRCLQGAEKRQVFDKRYADISKVSGMLPAPQKAKFVFQLLVPMLRLLVFFFRKDLDQDRLCAMVELVQLSSTAADNCNFLRIFLVDDSSLPKDATRTGCLVLLEKLFAALLSSERNADVLKLLKSLQKALFSPGPDYKPLESMSGMVVAHLMRKTNLFQVLPPLCHPGEILQAADVVLLMSSGLDSISLETVEASLRARQELLAKLLVSPNLLESLCEVSSNPTAAECLGRLCSLLVHTAGVLSTASYGQDRSCAAATLANIATLLERFALRRDADPGQLLALLTWLSWSKEALSGDDAKPGSKTLARLHRGSFVRTLLSAIGRARDDVLLAVCRLYFAPSNGTAEAEVDPPLEVLQTLAFATPLAERLFPTFGGLMRNRSSEAVFEALQPPQLANAEAIRLRVFCCVYAVQLQPMYDYEFFGDANPLRPEEVRELLPFLNRLAYHFVTSMPDQASLLPAAKALRTSLTSLINLLYHRHQRRPILDTDAAWIIPESRTLLRRAPTALNLGVAEPETVETIETLEDDPMEVDDERAPGEVQRGTTSATSSQASAEKALQAVLEEMPHVLPFEDRVSILHNAILADQEQRRAFRGPWGLSTLDKRQIRRNFLVEDGIAAFEGLDENALRDTFRVEFIAPDGTVESGVDGGGLFKEFMIHICREMFDPQFGLFSATSDHALYPSTAALTQVSHATDLYIFLGKVVGKAIYEMFLLEPQFSRVFLNRLLGRINEVDDIASLDKEVHRNMLQIKECSDVEALGITFSISIAEKGVNKDLDLIPNGSNTPVTRENHTRYLHLMANYRTNIQFQRQTVAFLSGLQKVIPVTWLKMFDPYELNTLISGSTAGGFDVKDLRENTVLSGGYQDDSPCVQWLWRLLQEDLSPEDLGRFLMFCTSCSRAPLLGFKNLNPKFCVHRVPDSDRLPTSATCANLLKLPDYVNYHTLKAKVLQAIRAEAGFDLS